MKGKKGFTLIELLAVIVILAIILMIVVPNILRSYNDERKKLYVVMQKNICRASNMYFEEYQAGTVTEEEDFCSMISTTEVCNIRIEKLMNEKYLDEDLVNPITDKPITESTVLIQASNNTANSAQKDNNGIPIYSIRVTIDEDEFICNQ